MSAFRFGKLIAFLAVFVIALGMWAISAVGKLLH
jgi:hypothetical protein